MVWDFFDLEANSFAQCLASRCASCSRTSEESQCPDVTSFTLSSTREPLGRDITLKATAFDRDTAPSTLTYTWKASDDTIGTIEDSSAAETRFTCTALGKTTLTLTISDGDTTCDWTKSISVRCLAPNCKLAKPLVASARAAFIGESVTLTIDVVDPLAEAFEYEWSETPDSIGALSSADITSVTYTCASAGLATVTVKATKPDDTCSTTEGIVLACVDPTSATPEPSSTRSALTGAYAGRDNQACFDCAAAYDCLDPQGTLPCEYSSNAAEQALCLRLLQCQLEAGLASDGSNPGAGQCASQLENAAQSAGRADLLTQCLATHECASCFPPKDGCPIIQTAMASPESAAIGQTITLSVVASDADNGPYPLTYRWVGTHGLPHDIGRIPDPNSPETTLICGVASTRKLAIIVNDGQCTDTRFVEVTCLDNAN